MELQQEEKADFPGPGSGGAKEEITRARLVPLERQAASHDIIAEFKTLLQVINH